MKKKWDIIWQNEKIDITLPRLEDKSGKPISCFVLFYH